MIRGLTKSVTQGSHFYVNLIYKRKLHILKMTRRLPDICTMNKERSGTLLMFFISFFMQRNIDFLGLRSGPLDVFGSGFSLMGFFLTIWPHSHIPVTIIPEYPPWGFG